MPQVDDEDLKIMRGIMYALLFSLPFYAIIALIAWAVFWR